MRFNIIIPNYNKKDYLAECIRSCASQKYDDYKIIFVDNESDDDSLNLAKETFSKFDAEYIIDTAENIYPHCWDECLQKAFQYIDGDYYTIVGSDDYISQNYLSNFAQWLENQKDKVFCAQSDLLWMRNGDIASHTRHEYADMDNLKNLMTQGCPVNSPSVFYHIDIFKDKSIKRLPEEYSGAADYDFYCQMVNKDYYIHNINDFIGYYYRMNPDQATWQMLKKPISHSDLIQNKWKEKWKKY